jgi:hypothetical protein
MKVSEERQVVCTIVERRKETQVVWEIPLVL